MANYLHGVETIDVMKGSTPVRVVKSSVIGLVGIAPTGAKNTPILVLSEQDHAQFGSQIPGFSIPQALAAIASQGAGTVVVVNVFDETAHTSAVTNEVLTAVAGGKTKTSFAPVGATALVLKSNDATTTYVAGTDYSVDVYGNITVLSSAIANGDQPKATYKKLNASAVTASTIIGSVDGTTGARTGFKCLDLVYPTWGFKTRKLIAPGYSVLNAVKTEMITYANKFRGHAYIDAPEGITPSAAIAGRGITGSINFQTSDKRAVLLYPMVKVYDAATDTNVNRSYSAFFAGMRAATIDTEGPHVSSSNKEIKGIVGTERTITAAIDDANTEANALNEAGIVTVFNAFGTGIRSWGNRSAAWPTSTAPSNFECVQDVADILRDSIDQAMLTYIDRPIDSPVIDAILGTVQNFLNTVKGRGWIVDGKVSYDAAKNPPTEIALGHLTFDLEFMPPTPMERVTFNHFININLLKAL